MKGYTANVVFVTVSDNHALDFVAIFPQIGDIGQHDVNAMHVIGRKRQTCIQENNFVIKLKNASVFANFVQSTEGNNF